MMDWIEQQPVYYVVADQERSFKRIWIIEGEEVLFENKQRQS